MPSLFVRKEGNSSHQIALNIISSIEQIRWNMVHLAVFAVRNDGYEQVLVTISTSVQPM